MTDWRMLNDAQWLRIADLLPGKPTDRGGRAADNRLFVEAVLYLARTGAPKKNGSDQAMGRSRGGLTTKIHACVDALGNPVRLILTGGLVNDVTQQPYTPHSIDWHRYKARNLIERFFNRLKQFRRIATRYDKLACRFNAFLHLVSAYIWLL